MKCIAYVNNDFCSLQLCLSLSSSFFQYLETKQSKQHIKSQDPVYDEVRTQKIMAGYKEGQSLQDDRIKVNANECYRKAQCDDINLKDCVAYSGLK